MPTLSEIFDKRKINDSDFIENEEYITSMAELLKNYK